jgi:hypothetical protein
MMGEESKKEVDFDLLADEALGELDDFERLQLGERLSSDDRQNLAQLECVVTALDLAFDKDRQMSLPPDLRQSILERAQAHFATDQAEGDRGTKPALESGDYDAKSKSRKADELPIPAKMQWTRRELFAWFTTAASVTAAGGLWFSQFAENGEVKEIALSRERLISTAEDLIQADWKDGKSPWREPVTGDIVWSSMKQTGFMRFRGMPVNNPLQEQYQLWIIDPLRDDEPIDGGVFDITSTNDVVIPVNAKLQVIKPAAFAITIEKPGGVVVSKQERLPLLATVR